MITLNLISQDLKKKIKLSYIHIFLKRIDLIFLIAVIFISIIFLSTKFILQRRFEKVVAETSLINKSSQVYNDKVKEVNNKISSVRLIQADYIFWSRLFYDLDSRIVKDISFSYMSVNEKNLKIRGRAKTRDSLLAFKEGLNKSDIISEINFPMSNILEKENIDFEISAKINLSELKK